MSHRKPSIHHRLIGLGLFLIVISSPQNLNAQNKLTSHPNRVKITDFEIDLTEVSVGQYREFTKATGYKTQAEKQGYSYEWGSGWEERKNWNYLYPYGEKAEEDEPAANINFYDAEAYCRWAGGRLPTSEEWALAAYTELRDSPPPHLKKGKTYPYSSGEKAENLNANWDQDLYPRQSPVKSMQPGINGLYHMGGNLWEWGVDSQGEHRITMGSSWWYYPDNSKRSGFQFKPADFSVIYIGFRCVY